MKKHYVCKPRYQGDKPPIFDWDKPLVFDWDEEAGEVSGPSAAIILDMSTWPYIPIYPPPQGWDLSPEPLKSRADMAAIIGYKHYIPEDLAAYYPGLSTPKAEDGVIY